MKKKKEEVSMADVSLDDFDSMEEKIESVIASKIEADRISMTEGRRKPGRQRGQVTEHFKDPDVVKNMSIKDIESLTRYQLYRLNKHREQLGLQPFDRRKTEEN